ncbi:MAG: hypothetical protein LBS55_03055 [Prevotellaceae bacterium]|nr:hypothetical protein [Prevotellaceae bacterium]
MIMILDIAGYWICEKYAAREEKMDVFSTLNSVYQNRAKEQLFGLNNEIYNEKGFNWHIFM